jgi:hypothetical protein
VLPFSNKTGIAWLYSIFFKGPAGKRVDLTNGSRLKDALAPFREYKSSKMVE